MSIPKSRPSKQNERRKHQITGINIILNYSSRSRSRSALPNSISKYDYSYFFFSSKQPQISYCSLFKIISSFMNSFRHFRQSNIMPMFRFDRVLYSQYFTLGVVLCGTLIEMNYATNTNKKKNTFFLCCLYFFVV